MLLETVAVEHVPASHTVHVALFRGVANAAFLQAQLLARNADFEYAFIDAATVASRFHLLSAVYKAVAAELAGAMKTPNVHSEIVTSLSSNNNIAEAYRRFGVQPATQDVVVVKVLIAREGEATTTTNPPGPRLTADDVEAHLRAHVQGDPVPCSDEELGRATDWPRLRKYHKLNGLPWLDALPDEAARRRELELLVVAGMAMRGA